MTSKNITVEQIRDPENLPVSTAQSTALGLKADKLFTYNFNTLCNSYSIKFN